jgi:hypothetical protein
MYDPTRHVCIEPGCNQLSEPGDTLCYKHRRIQGRTDGRIPFKNAQRLVAQGTHEIRISTSGDTGVIALLVPISSQEG